MTDDNKVTSVAGFIEQVKYCYDEHLKSGKHLFFRGQGKRSWGLEPSIMRKDEKKDGKKEKEVVLDFHHYSASHSIDYKLDEDIVSLLEDMQHHEIPTRLLDWSVAPLHALFFAVSNWEEDKKEGENKDENSAVVYVLNPWGYNKSILELAGRDYGYHSKIQDAYICGRALLSTYKKDDISQIIKKVNERYSIELEEKDFKYPFSFVSNYTNRRVHSQKGVFTISGKESLDLKDNNEFKKHSFEIIIDKDSKKEIYEELHRLYINEYTIYPDLVGMKKLFDRKNGLFNI